MGYGNTYTREPIRKPTKEEISRENSLVTSLVVEAGYNREDFGKIELETKIDVSLRKFTKNPFELYFGDNLPLPEPYSGDKILEGSKSHHSFYAFVNKNLNKLECAFTKVEREGRTKIKLKDNSEQIFQDEIILLKRDEKHLQNLTPLEINKYILDIARKSNLPLEYVGTFLKKSKERFIFNPTSGRIFVLATNICEIESNTNKLNQLEIEYYGQINGFSSIKDVYHDLGDLCAGILKKFPKGYSAKSSKLTKFDWLVKNIN